MKPIHSIKLNEPPKLGERAVGIAKSASSSFSCDEPITTPPVVSIGPNGFETHNCIYLITNPEIFDDWTTKGKKAVDGKTLHGVHLYVGSLLKRIAELEGKK